MDWGEKYRPVHLDEVVGNSTALRQMLEWAKSWTRESQPLILYGKAGTGKTSSAWALAHDMRWEVVELNASDQRTGAVIDRVAGGGSTTASLTGATRKLILLDEADNLQGTADRGGARAIVDMIRSSRQPVILIANDLYAVAGEIRSRCVPVQFKALQARSIVPRLRFICAAERVACDEGALQRIAEAARGDMRAAVTMLYASAAGREKLLEDGVLVSRKDRRSSVFDLVTAVYGSRGSSDLLRLAFEVEETPDTLIQWVEGNLAGLQTVTEYQESYRAISRADEYLGYTYRQQYHTLWRYATSLALLGVSRVAAGRGIHARISPPERWKRMGSSQKSKAIRSSMLRKVSSSLHMPRGTLMDGYLPLLGVLIDADPLPYAREFSLDADEVNLFLHDRTRSQQVARTIAAEEREMEVKKEREKSSGGKKKPAPGADPTPEPPPGEEIAPDGPREDKVPVRDQKTLFNGF
jgi:replication factor C large subunit